MKINTWDLWQKEWKNASNFFETKGNIEAKSKLKDKWHEDFRNMCFMIEREALKDNRKKG